MKLSEFPISDNMQQCPCCDYFSLAQRGHCLVCPVCFWEDDCEDPNNSKWDAPSDLNDNMCLREARKNFIQHGAWKPEYSSIVIQASERSLLRVVRRNV